MSISNDGFGTLFESIYTGGGGFTIIPNGGDLDGTYNNNVYCEGDVNLTGTTIVKGSLWIAGTIYGPDGFGLSVEGDLFSHVWDFAPDDDTVPQSDIEVGGNFFFTDFYWPQCGGTARLLRVGGDLTGTIGASTSPFNASGLDDTATNGASVTVYGSILTGPFNVSGSDADAGLSKAAGNGGIIYCYGSMHIAGTFRTEGGDGDAGFDAGNGGNLYVWGDGVVDGDLRTDGGYGNASSGGQGGDVLVYGNLTLEDDLQTEGGDGDINGGDAGDADIRGSLVCNDIFCDGGSGYNGNGGNGPSIQVYGDMSVDDEIEMRGGNGNNGNGGYGGYLSCEGSIVSNDLYIYGGAGTNGVGGSGGTIYVDGNLHAQYIEFYGGSGSQQSGGTGGNLEVEGDINCTYLEGSGGSCNSTNEAHFSGSAGNVDTATLDVNNNNIYLVGGNRTGATTVANLANSVPNGGNIYCTDLFADYIDLSGGDITTDYANSVGGSSGSIFCSGAMIVSSAYLDGGNSNGNNGGNGGEVIVSGTATISSALAVRGGNADASVDVPAGGTNGAGSDVVRFLNGCHVVAFNCTDGAGIGAAPTGQMNLYLAGSCHFSTINMTDRVDARIRPNYEGAPVTLQIVAMTDKDTLDTWDGAAVSSSIAADLGTSLFINSSVGAGNWYKIAGVSAM